MLAYLSMMAPRLIELRRALKPSGRHFGFVINHQNACLIGITQLW
jgi:hypothetical protein